MEDIALFDNIVAKRFEITAIGCIVGAILPNFVQYFYFT